MAKKDVSSFSARIPTEVYKSIQEHCKDNDLSQADYITGLVVADLGIEAKNPPVRIVLENLQAKVIDLEHRLGESNEALLKFIGNKPNPQQEKNPA